MADLAERLGMLRARCSSLSMVAIFINWPEESDCNGKILKASDPLLQQLRSFKDQGIHTAYFVRVEAPITGLCGYESWSENEPRVFSARGNRNGRGETQDSQDGEVEEDEHPPTSDDGLSSEGGDVSNERVSMQGEEEEEEDSPNEDNLRWLVDPIGTMLDERGVANPLCREEGVSNEDEANAANEGKGNEDHIREDEGSSQ